MEVKEVGAKRVRLCPFAEANIICIANLKNKLR